ncbi:MAG: ABC transporter permease [Wenzhouxiangellaceae bacterium]|nr:ABC transporter permease [Wenzhouxiangellaceae bacterium]
MRQILEISLQNLKSLPRRLGPSLVAVIGVAGVVAVLVAVLSMARGFERTLMSGASPDNLVVLRSGSSSELDSGLPGDQARIIAQDPGIEANSMEVFVMVDLEKVATDSMANAPFRGVGLEAIAIREDMAIVEGRMFEPGRRELIAGRGATGQYRGVRVGQTLEFGSERWNVVGIFSGGGAAQSELWTDAAVLQDAFRRGTNFSSVRGRLAPGAAFEDVKDRLTTDPRLSVQVERETEYYAEQSEALSTFISVAGYGIAALMALGALFGALNTMYTAVADRSREIGTLRALGFAPVAIVTSVLLEAMLLALAGGVIGASAAWLVFHGLTVSTLSFTSFTQVVFDFAVTPGLLFQGLVLALAIGFLGGLAPAVRAVRMPIVSALRD